MVRPHLRTRASILLLQELCAARLLSDSLLEFCHPLIKVIAEHILLPLQFRGLNENHHSAIVFAQGTGKISSLEVIISYEKMSECE